MVEMMVKFITKKTATVCIGMPTSPLRARKKSNAPDNTVNATYAMNHGTDSRGP